MNYQTQQMTSQLVKVMATLITLGVGTGMARPIMLQESAIPYSVALGNARRWASEHAATSDDAGAVLAYINAIPLARREAEGERMQLLYVLSNLSSWRGPEARQSKEAIKKRIKSLGG